jgi:hypothetical protein
MFVLTIGNRRYVWYDELFTFDIARSPLMLRLTQPAHSGCPLIPK